MKLVPFTCMNLRFALSSRKKIILSGKLSEDKVELLNEIGFSFACKPRDRFKKVTRTGNKPFLDDEEWEVLFQDLVDYKEENGDCDVPQRSGRYVFYCFQRCIYKRDY